MTSLSKSFRVVIVFITLALTIGCGKRSMTIEFVFPDGFTGIAKLRSGQPSGASLAASNGIILLVFPPSGVLDVQGKLPTLDWHTPIAHFRNGDSIPILTPPNQVSDDTFALRPLGL